MGFRQFQKNQRETVHEEYFSSMNKKDFMPFFDAQTAGRRFLAQHAGDVDSKFESTIFVGKSDPAVPSVKLGSAYFWKLMDKSQSSTGTGGATVRNSGSPS